MGSPPALRRRAGGGGWVTGAPLPAPPPRAAPAPGSRTAPLWRALLCMRPQQSYSSYSGRRPYLAAVLDRIKGCFSKKGPWAAKKQQEKQPEKRQGGKLQCVAATAAAITAAVGCGIRTVPRRHRRHRSCRSALDGAPSKSNNIGRNRKPKSYESYFFSMDAT